MNILKSVVGNYLKVKQNIMIKIVQNIYLRLNYKGDYMKEIMILGKNTFTRQERAKAILLGNANADDFIYSFTFNGIDLFVKIKQEKIMTQDERILQHLLLKGKISQKSAIRLYGAYRLSAIIYRLRKEYNITTNYKSGNNRFGDRVIWAEYTLIK